MNFFTETAAAVVLRNRSSLAPQIAAITAERDRILTGLRDIRGLQVFDSFANFVLFRVESEGIEHSELFRRLLTDHGILIRDVSGYPMLAGCLRVNAGTPAETTAFLDATAAIMKESER
ncbi:MAG: hypothetical protein H0U67_14865 [Gemmatimonadetes bacterium]|nr:hypothetical protein [Gemmatimonadota bacterium]